jgi:hypothetical protein
MTEEFNLSERITSYKGNIRLSDILLVEDVKEFIKKLKEDVATSGFYNDEIRRRFILGIDKLAGDKLK